MYYTELLRSCGLIGDSSYWYCSQEELHNYEYCCSEYPDEVRVAKNVEVLGDVKLVYNTFVAYKKHEKIRRAVKCLLNKRKEKLIKLKLSQINADFV